MKLMEEPQSNHAFSEKAIVWQRETKLGTASVPEIFTNTVWDVFRRAVSSPYPLFIQHVTPIRKNIIKRPILQP